jgi:hypothetical protein
MIEERPRFDVIDQEQLAAQLVAIMDAHFQRPSADEKRYVLRLAASQLCDLNDGVQASSEVQSRPLVPAHYPT